MKLLIALVITLVLTVLLKEPIRKVPWVFYILALALDIIYLTGAALDIWRGGALAAWPFVMRGLVAISLFIIVMYLGVFSTNNKFRKWLMPIRGELSVIACILTFGHVINYLQSYLLIVLEDLGGVPATRLIAFLVAVVLLVLLIPLTITSFKTIKAKMNAASWKKLQSSAYVFFGLIYVHIAFVLGPSAFAGAREALISLISYTVIFVVYAVLRIRRAMLDKKATAEEAA